MRTIAVLTLVLTLAGGVEAKEKKAAALFGAVDVASNQSSEAIGSYSKGCGAGFVQLPESGPTWQAMRLSRNRNWGHPMLVQYIVDLSEAAIRIGWRGIYVGDMAQPRGGPSPRGISAIRQALTSTSGIRRRRAVAQSGRA